MVKLYHKIKSGGVSCRTIMDMSELSSKTSERGESKMELVLSGIEEQQHEALGPIEKAASLEALEEFLRGKNGIYIHTKRLPGWSDLTNEEKSEIRQTADIANAVVIEAIEKRQAELSPEEAGNDTGMEDESGRRRILSALLDASGFVEATMPDHLSFYSDSDAVIVRKSLYLDALEGERDSDQWTPEAVYEFLQKSEEARVARHQEIQQEKQEEEKAVDPEEQAFRSRLASLVSEFRSRIVKASSQEEIEGFKKTLKGRAGASTFITFGDVEEISDQKLSDRNRYQKYIDLIREANASLHIEAEIRSIILLLEAESADFQSAIDSADSLGALSEIGKLHKIGGGKGVRIFLERDLGSSPRAVFDRVLEYIKEENRRLRKFFKRQEKILKRAERLPDTSSAKPVPETIASGDTVLSENRDESPVADDTAKGDVNAEALEKGPVASLFGRKRKEKKERVLRKSAPVLTASSGGEHSVAESLSETDGDPVFSGEILSRGYAPSRVVRDPGVKPILEGELLDDARENAPEKSVGEIEAFEAAVSGRTPEQRRLRGRIDSLEDAVRAFEKEIRLKALAWKDALEAAEYAKRELNEKERMIKEKENFFRSIFYGTFTKKSLGALESERDELDARMKEREQLAAAVEQDIKRLKLSLAEAERDLESLAGEGGVGETPAVAGEEKESIESVADDMSKLFGDDPDSDLDPDMEALGVFEREIAAERAPEPAEESDATINDKEIMRRYESVGIAADDINHVKGFSELSPAKKLLVLENYKQMIVERIEVEAQANVEQETSGKWVGSRMWRNIMEAFYVKREKQVLAKKIFGETVTEAMESRDDSIALKNEGWQIPDDQIAELESKVKVEKESKQALVEKMLPGGVLQFLVEGAENGPEAVLAGGQLEIFYASGEAFEGVEKGVLRKFNEAATAFAGIPREWEKHTASKAEQLAYMKATNDFRVERTKVLSQLEQHMDAYDAMQIMNQTEAKIWMNGFFTSHQDIEGALLEAKEGSAISAVAKEFVTGNGVYMALGFAGRTIATGLLGWVAMPVAVGLAGTIGWARAKNRAAKEFEKGEKKMKAEVLARKVERLFANVDRAQLNDEKISPRSLVTLRERVRDIKEQFESGMIDFGPERERTTRRYELLQSLTRADAALAMYGAETEKDAERMRKLEDRAAKLFDIRRENVGKANKQLKSKRESERKEYLSRRAKRGALYAAGFAGFGAALGYAVREWLFTPHESVPAAAPSTPGAAQPAVPAVEAPVAASGVPDVAQPTAPAVETPVAAPSATALSIGKGSSIEGELIRHLEESGMSSSDAASRAHAMALDYATAHNMSFEKFDDLSRHIHPGAAMRLSSDADGHEFIKDIDLSTAKTGIAHHLAGTTASASPASVVAMPPHPSAPLEIADISVGAPSPTEAPSPLEGVDPPGEVSPASRAMMSAMYSGDVAAFGRIRPDLAGQLRFALGDAQASIFQIPNDELDFSTRFITIETLSPNLRASAIIPECLNLLKGHENFTALAKMGLGKEQVQNAAEYMYRASKLFGKEALPRPIESLATYLRRMSMLSVERGLPIKINGDLKAAIAASRGAFNR